MNARAHIVALLAAVSIATAYAADWPQYYGPRRDSTSTEKGLLRAWPKEGPNGNDKGGAVLAHGLLLATDGNTKLYLIEPDPTAFKPLASAELLEAADNWAPLALVDGRLFIRDQKQMKCVQVAQQVR
jgi:hypothetical protein